MATLMRAKPRKPTGYSARPWLKLIPRTKVTTDNRARLYLPSGVLTLDREVTASPVTMSLDEAATVTFSVADPSGSLDALALAQADESRLLSGIDVRWRALWWRITRIERDEGAWIVVCEDRIASYLQSHKRVVSASRADMTRAQFVRRLALGVKAGGGIPRYIPELKEKQGIYKPEQPKARKTAEKQISTPDGLAGTVWDSSGTTAAGGWGAAASKVTVKGKRADAAQLADLDEALREASSLGAAPRVMMAVVMTMTQESVVGKTVVSVSGRHHGNFHQEVGTGWARTVASAKSVKESTRRFLTGGDLGAPGWKQRFGSVKASTSGPLTLGGMIDRVQVAGTPAAFQQWEQEAKKTVDLWVGRNQSGPPSPGSSSTSNAFGDGAAAAASGVDDADRYYRGQYKFRTSDGEPMNWWDATGALADEVQRHRWAVSNTLGFATDREMIRGNPVLWISRDKQDVRGLKWTWDKRREASQMSVQLALTDPFQLLPGMVAMVDDEAPSSGRWLVESIDVDPCAGCIADVTLRRPGAKLLEPAPELKLRKESKVTIGGDGNYGVFGEDGGDAPGTGDVAGPPLPPGAGASRAIAFAERYIGKTESPPMSNRGAWGLDSWQKEFGHGAVPWCGILVGKALKTGGVKGLNGSVASVLQIHNNAKSGTGGFEKLVDKNQGQPGDAVGLFGLTIHVELIVKRIPGGYETIGGNTSGAAGSQNDGGGVYRKTRMDRDVVYVARPKWP
jgi:hypothetical protein